MFRVREMVSMTVAYFIVAVFYPESHSHTQRIIGQAPYSFRTITDMTSSFTEQTILSQSRFVRFV